MESSHQMVNNAKIKIGSHIYRSNWAISDLRYDILLEMPWHEEVKPRINYKKKRCLSEGKFFAVNTFE